MKITIPFNIFIFIWCLIGVTGLGYTYIQDLANGKNLFITREFCSQVFWFLLCLLYCLQYLKHIYASGSVIHGPKNIITGKKS
jgi:H+/Cl- antiporter ClcA